MSLLAAEIAERVEAGTEIYYVVNTAVNAASIDVCEILALIEAVQASRL